jgi:hypothetical protein
MGHIPLPWDEPLNQIVQFLSGGLVLLGFALSAFHRWETQDHSNSAACLGAGVIGAVIWVLSRSGVI